MLRLHDSRRRRQAGLVLVEGPKLLAEAVASGATVVELLAEESDTIPVRLGIPATTVTDDVLRALSTTESPQSPVAVVRPHDKVFPEAGDALVAWGVADPGNLGALIRSAAAFGFAVAVGGGACDPWSPKAVRAAAGVQFTTPLLEINDLAELGERRLVATVVSGGVPPEAIDEPRAIALVVGSETHGLDAQVLAKADSLVTIPASIESLNASVAGSIAMFALAGRRRARD